MNNEERVYNAIKSGAKSHFEIKQKLDLSQKDILIYTAKLEQQGYIFQLSQGYFYITSKKLRNDESEQNCLQSSNLVSNRAICDECGDTGRGRPTFKNLMELIVKNVVANNC